MHMWISNGTDMVSFSDEQCIPHSKVLLSLLHALHMVHIRKFTQMHARLWWRVQRIACILDTSGASIGLTSTLMH